MEALSTYQTNTPRARLRTLRRVMTFVFLAIQMLVIVRNLETDFFSFYWYCDFTPGVLAVLFLIGNVQLIKGFLNLGLGAQFGYLVVVLSKILFGVGLFGFVFDFPFTVRYILPSIIIHLTTLFAFSVTYHVRPARSALVYSFVYLLVIYTIVLLFAQSTGTTGTNFNFIFASKTLHAVPHYTQLWVPLAFVLVVLPTQAFQYVVYRIQKTRGPRNRRR